MKKLILNIFTRILWIRARQSIQQNNPKIIGITGSVGKTTTRDFLSTILSSQYTIQAAKRSFNTPIGIAFTILGIEKSPYSNPFRWIHLIVSVFISPLPKFDILILEMGADTPGDISDLLSCVSIDYAIITHITENHIAE
ncbi:MAG: Mur ligase family protein [Patescibacteria group bacterium]|nr:Mur ligase family protein [Patescibacteria group bacterium]